MQAAETYQPHMGIMRMSSEMFMKCLQAMETATLENKRH